MRIILDQVRGSYARGRQLQREITERLNRAEEITKMAEFPTTAAV